MHVSSDRPPRQHDAAPSERVKDRPAISQGPAPAGTGASTTEPGVEDGAQPPVRLESTGGQSPGRSRRTEHNGSGSEAQLNGNDGDSGNQRPRLRRKPPLPPLRIPPRPPVGELSPIAERKQPEKKSCGSKKKNRGRRGAIDVTPSSEELQYIRTEDSVFTPRPGYHDDYTPSWLAPFGQSPLLTPGYLSSSGSGRHVMPPMVRFFGDLAATQVVSQGRRTSLSIRRGSETGERLESTIHLTSHSSQPSVHDTSGVDFNPLQ